MIINLRIFATCCRIVGQGSNNLKKYNSSASSKRIINGRINMEIEIAVLNIKNPVAPMATIQVTRINELEIFPRNFRTYLSK